MNSILNITESIILFSMFAITMIGIVLYYSRKNQVTINSYLVADREVSTFKGAMSIAVSWIWAPAIFICGLQSYQNGLAGIFWFTFPNILCFFVFIPIAIKLRKLIPNGYTFPNFISEIKFKNEKLTHISFVFIFLSYQLGALIINSLAGGYLINAISGINIRFAIFLFLLIPLSYSIKAGLKTSIITDVIQMLMIIIITFILVPLSLNSINLDISASLAGIKGSANIFNPEIFIYFGIPTTISLISGPLADQMFFQRALAVKQENIKKTFIIGSIIFAIIPILLSFLGFIGVQLSQQGLITVNDPQLISLEVINYLLPKIAVYAFTIMALAGLSSTIDSSLCAISSLVTIDIYNKYFSHKNSIFISRLSMIFITLISLTINMFLPKLLWIFLIYGVIASSVFFPVIYALYRDNIPAKRYTYAIILSISIGLPFSIYSNWTENNLLILLSSLLTIFVSFFVLNFKKYHFNR